jgi:hypothetical protein
VQILPEPTTAAQGGTSTNTRASALTVVNLPPRRPGYLSHIAKPPRRVVFCATLLP